MENEERLRAALADRYIIEREIGVGGMATVYLARDLKHDRQVAVKVLDPELAQSLGAERFLREIKTAANLTHPHILPLHDSGEADGFLYYVMPYVKGESLRARLTSEKQLPVEDAVQIAREIAGALAYAHKEGVLHRDVKPANIMLEEGHAVLADFGIAQAVSEAKGDRITKLGFSPGTPAYMSPEQASGDQELDGRSDQYALGCVLYEMLSGETPFTGSTPAAILAGQINGRLPPLAVVRQNLPGGLVEALEKALAKVPADRHQTSTDFMNAIVQGSTRDLAVGRPPGRMGPGRVMAAVGLVLVAAWGVYQLTTGGPDPGIRPEGALARIAVTYFDDHTEGRELGYLADALTEQVANVLTQLETFEVLPLNAMKPYKEIGLSAEDVEVLGIDAYVEGALIGTADNLSVSVQLIDAGDQSHIESEVVRGNVVAPLPILEGLAGEVSGLLREWLGVRMERVELQAGTESGAAWNLVQQGAERLDDAIQLSASGDTAAAARVLIEADLILERAEYEDPSYITPIIDRGWVAAELASLATAQARFDTIWTRVGIGHADRALQKDPDHPRALELRGVLLDYLASETTEAKEADFLLAQAEADLRRATELDESRSQALSRLSWVYEKLGRLAEAKLAATKAYSSDPYQREAPVILFRLCSASLQLQLWTEVTEYCGEGRERFPDDETFPSAQLAALAGPRGLVADPDLAWELAEDVIRLSAPHERGRSQPPQLLQVAAVLARAGFPDSARAVMDRALALPEASGSRVDVQEANTRLRLGDVDEALDALDRYFEANPSERAGAPTDWWWEEVWDHPRFKELADPAGGGSGSD